jgi:hypothetical protein
MKILIMIACLFISFLGISQDYPKLDTDSLGNQVITMTLQQAQKLDNNMEILSILEKAIIDCDNMSNSYIKVIDEQKKTITLLELDNILLKEQILDKDKSIENIQLRLNNSIEISNKCESQKAELDGQIEVLKGEVTSLKTKRNIAYGVGVLGTIGVILVLIFK